MLAITGQTLFPLSHADKWEKEKRWEKGGRESKSPLRNPFRVFAAHNGPFVLPMRGRLALNRSGERRQSWEKVKCAACPVWFPSNLRGDANQPHET